MSNYAELHCLSCYSFLRGASHPHELVERAAALGYGAIAITDECSLAGIVKAHVAAREVGIQLIVGSEFLLEEGFRLLALLCEVGGSDIGSQCPWRQSQVQLSHRPAVPPAQEEYGHRARGSRSHRPDFPPPA